MCNKKVFPWGYYTWIHFAWFACFLNIQNFVRYKAIVNIYGKVKSVCYVYAKLLLMKGQGWVNMDDVCNEVSVETQNSKGHLK